ncbi:hypothetical protein COM24_06745 [Bacillus toyonensis]|nr:hypothetical protein COM24_06745 [Bacillus toyonensis]SFM37192.1 4Fe-4S single cluster domain-containing protein [Bacillus sp. 5mfcol3.1]
MRVMNIIQDSVVDGEELRTVVFFVGCPHHCLGCHNPKSWNFYNFSQEDSFLKEREVSRWEMNWLRTRDGRKPS